MQYIVIAVSAAIFTIILLAVYKYGLNPQIIIQPDSSSMTVCPDRWNLNSEKQMCEPSYSTHCLPFSPKSPNLTTVTQKCSLAGRCSTGWSGMCT
jgi:hypothetical protein